MIPTTYICYCEETIIHLDEASHIMLLKVIASYFFLLLEYSRKKN
jgi:hypothetical protein